MCTAKSGKQTPHLGISYVLMYYLAGTGSERMYAISKDWHQFIDRSISFRYRVLGMAIHVHVGDHGTIPEEVL